MDTPESLWNTQGSPDLTLRTAVLRKLINIVPEPMFLATLLVIAPKKKQTQMP